MAEIRHVKPGGLRLPPTRPEGADQVKLFMQTGEFGKTFEDMPALWVTECMGGELLINNGVTRATRAFLADPNITVPVEIIDAQSSWNVSWLPTVADKAVPESEDVE